MSEPGRAPSVTPADLLGRDEAPDAPRPTGPDRPSTAIGALVECIDCGARQTHRVCADCFVERERPLPPPESLPWRLTTPAGSPSPEGQA